MRKHLLIVMLLLAAMLLASCQGGGQPAATQAPVEQPGEEPADTPTEAPEEPADTPTEPAEEPADTPTEPVEEATEPAEDTGAAGQAPEDELGVVEIAPGDPIVLAYALVVAGADATLGEDSRRGVEIALADAGNELLGHPIELIGEDTGCNAEGGQAAATRLVANEQIVAIIGTSCSSEARVAAPVVDQAGMVLISPSNTAPDLTDPETHVPGYLRTAHNDEVQGRVVAEFAFNELGLTRAATIHDGSPYAEGLVTVFADVFTELGGEMVSEEAVGPEDTDMRPVLTRVAAQEPELIYYPIFIQAGGFVTRQAREVEGLEEVVLIGSDGLFSPEFLNAAGDAVQGMYLSSPDFSAFQAGYEEFLAKHEEEYGEATLSAFHAHAYDATNMILQAIEQVAVEGEDGTLWIGRQALRDALYATEDYQGLTGNLTCDENGDCADPVIAVYEVVDADPDAWTGGTGDNPNPQKVYPEAGAAEGEGEAEETPEAEGEETPEAEAEETPEADAEETPEADAEAEDVLMSQSADCEDEGYTGLFQEIAAVDELTVRFTMCRPDPAFLSKVAFTSYAIQPAEWLEETGGTGELIERPIGTGPYMIERWDRGESITFTRFDEYWGEPAQAETLVFRWSAEAAQRLLELQSGTVHGIDNPGPDDFETIANDPNLQLIERPALNTMYIGMNNTYEPFTDERVRQAIAMGIDRQRIVDNFYPPGSEVASHFTPCAIPNGCAGEEWYEFDVEAARALLAEAGYEEGFDTVINYRDVVRGYLPDPGVVAQDIQAQLLENLNIRAEIEVMESGAFLDASDQGQLQGLYLLGWGADYPDVTNFLDFHFGAGASEQFGEKFEDITSALQEGASLSADEDRAPHYEAANNAIKQHVPMVPVAHGGSGVAYLATVEGAHASPLGNEAFSVMSPGDDGDTFVWMQNGEPPGLYCADESDGEALRACEQVTEGLYAYEIGGTAPIPALAESCEPNEDLTVWTCTLREGVTFHDGSTLDSTDVFMTYVVQWDAAHPLHVGRDGSFTYFPGLWGGFLNPPPPEE